jgi:hypothetical protein
MAMIKRMIAIAAGALAVVAYVAAAGNGAAATADATPAPKIFVAKTAVGPTQLARYSATTGNRLKFLTAPEPGGGVNGPELSADGSTVLFARSQGTCAQTIDTVPTRGGAERVLIPMTGVGKAATFPDDASLSADGRYLLFNRTFCAGLSHDSLYLRNMRTGRTVLLARHGPQLMSTAAFITHDRQVVYWDNGKLAVLNLRTLRLRFHTAPSGCRYGPLATPGIATAVTATLDCGPFVKVVTISPAAFRISAPIANLRGRCMQAVSISIAQRDPHALLLEVTSCHDTERIVTIRRGRAMVLLSGPSRRMPQYPAW